jgi:Family of unknown function (DUF6441)
MRLEAAIKGKLHEFMAAEAEAAKKAVTEAVKDVGQHIKQELYEQTEAAGLGRGVAHAWRLQVFPKGKASLNAAAYVKSNAPKIVYAFNYGVTIKSTKGWFLAIPTPAAPKRGTNGKRISPSNFPESSLGKLRFVYRSRGLSLLVVDDLRARGGKRGGFGKASESALRTGRGITTVVMFFLVPQVSLRKRLDIEAVAHKWGDQTAQMVLNHWPEVKIHD